MNTNTQPTMPKRFLVALMWGAWVVALLAVLVALVSSKDELQGNLAFSLILASVLVVLTMIPALLIGALARDVSRVCWIALSLAIIGFTVYVGGLDHPEARRDAGTFFVIAMTVLTFPLGIVALALASVVVKLWTGSSAGSQVLLCSVAFISVGYIQWWRLAPAILRRFVTRVDREVDAVAPGKSS